jgi:hypothetical protein
VSKAANVICLGLILLLAVWYGTNGLRAENRRTWLLAMLSLLVVAAVAFTFGLEKTMNRWGDLFGTIHSGSKDSRLQAYEIIVRGALPDAGCWGFGPGTFEKIFDLQRANLRSELVGRWDKAHSDALQTPMEWGWAGAAAWLLLLGGGLFNALFLIRRRSTESVLAAAGALALAGVMFHALLDFPLQMASLQLFTLLIAGLCWGLPKKTHPLSNHHHSDAFSNSEFPRKSNFSKRRSL